jgi:hypothetical protein
MTTHPLMTALPFVAYAVAELDRETGSLPVADLSTP